MKNGYIGTILRVNLNTGAISKEPLNEKNAKDYVGARGLGTKYFCDECDPKCDPFGPGNNLIMMTGPLTGTMATSSGRYNAVCKSPLTGTIEASNSGGHFGPELKFAGYDGIIFEGISEKPVYLYINDDVVELRDASAMWGMDVFDTTEALYEECGNNFRIACISKAAEEGCLFAGVMNDKHRAAGRGGVGAVMGSKKLKAVAVKGTGSVFVARPEKFFDVCAAARKQLAEHPVTGAGLGQLGTMILVNIVNGVGGFPINNLRDGSCDPLADDISGETLAAKHLIRNKGCFGCSIGCGRLVEIAEGEFKSKGEGPEYEAGWSFGGDCGVHDIGAVCKANFLCNQYGLDPITMGATVACAMELFEMGAIKEEEIGFPLRFGDATAMVKATEITCKGEGFGKIMGLGSYRMAEKYGHPELSMSVKKQEMPAYDGRAIQGIGLEYATSNRGGCHVRGYMISPEVLGIPMAMDPLVTTDKAATLKIFQDLTALCDSTGICLFTTFGQGLPEIAAMYREAVGSDESDEEILLKGERIWNLEKKFNQVAGIEKDTLPPRLLRETLPEGPAEGRVSELETMLKEYYEVRGWNADGTVPAEKYESLNIEA